MVALDKELCINICPYYKPSKKEELSCKGFSVVERLIKGGRNISFKKSDKKLDTSTEEKLVQTLCITCPFYQEDCDFIQNRAQALPCGGFILLGQLFESDVLTIDEIVRNID